MDVHPLYICWHFEPYRIPSSYTLHLSNCRSTSNHVMSFFFWYQLTYLFVLTTIFIVDSFTFPGVNGLASGKFCMNQPDFMVTRGGQLRKTRSAAEEVVTEGSQGCTSRSLPAALCVLAKWASWMWHLFEEDKGIGDKVFNGVLNS